MSLDIFVSIVMNREEDKFDRLIVERAFAPLCDDVKSDYWYLHTDRGEETSGTVLIDDEPEITNFSIGRPPFIPEFWNAIYEVMRQTNTILVWPGSGPHPTYCVANPDFLGELPADMIKDMGQPAFVRSGAEIEAAVERSA